MAVKNLARYKKDSACIMGTKKDSSLVTVQQPLRDSYWSTGEKSL